MTDLRQNRRRFQVVDRDCIGRVCLALGTYHHRGATMSGSRNTGDTTDGCLTNMNHGCPSPKPDPTPALARERRDERIRIVT